LSCCPKFTCTKIVANKTTTKNIQETKPDSRYSFRNKIQHLPIYRIFKILEQQWPKLSGTRNMKNISEKQKRMKFKHYISRKKFSITVNWKANPG